LYFFSGALALAFLGEVFVLVGAVETSVAMVFCRWSEVVLNRLNKYHKSSFHAQAVGSNRMRWMSEVFVLRIMVFGNTRRRDRRRGAIEIIGTGGFSSGR